MKKFAALFCFVSLIVLLFSMTETVGAQEYTQQYGSAAASDSYTVARVPNIKGKWKGKWTSKTEWSGSLRMIIKQDGSKVRGTMDVTNTDCGNYGGISFTGKIKDNIVNFSASTWCEEYKVKLKFANGKIGKNVIKGKYAIYVDGDIYDSGTFRIERK